MVGAGEEEMGGWGQGEKEEEERARKEASEGIKDEGEWTAVPNIYLPEHKWRGRSHLMLESPWPPLSECSGALPPGLA